MNQQLLNKILGEWRETEFAKNGGWFIECCDYEGMYEQLESFLTQSLTQVYQSAIDDAIKCVPEEKGKTGDFNMTFSDGVTSSIPIESNFDAGFNEACTQTLNNLEKLR